MHSEARVQLKGSLQLGAFYDQQLPSVCSQYHPLPLPLWQPGMRHIALGLPLGKGTGEQLEAVFGSLEALEDAAAYHTDDAVALAHGARIEEALQFNKHSGNDGNENPSSRQGAVVTIVMKGSIQGMAKGKVKVGAHGG